MSATLNQNASLLSFLRSRQDFQKQPGAKLLKLKAIKIFVFLPLPKNKRTTNGSACGPKTYCNTSADNAGESVTLRFAGMNAHSTSPKAGAAPLS
jgi:hypothetical protein